MSPRFTHPHLPPHLPSIHPSTPFPSTIPYDRPLLLPSTFPSSLQDISPGLLLSCWSHTISSSLAGTYDHRQSTAGVVGLLAHAMLINKSQVRTCLHYYNDSFLLTATPQSACMYCPYPPDTYHVHKQS